MYSNSRRRAFLGFAWPHYSLVLTVCRIFMAQDAKNEKKFRDIMTHVSEKRAEKFNTLWTDPTANPQVP